MSVLIIVTPLEVIMITVRTQMYVEAYSIDEGASHLLYVPLLKINYSQYELVRQGLYIYTPLIFSEKQLKTLLL